MSRTHGSTGGGSAEGDVCLFNYLRNWRGEKPIIGLGDKGEADTPRARGTLGGNDIGNNPDEPVTSRGSTGVIGGSGRTMIDTEAYDPKVEESKQKESGEGGKGITG